ncbi:MAG: class I SAM-dependent methyltransferase [Deltaproteobacteria bacterium]|nr:MAG: class I SAM-dependent methyltransferase [Deltaproteobacteria bacterium]
MRNSLLDLAAGEGRNALWLAERGWDVEAVDFAERALERGRALAARRGVRVRWRNEDLTAWASEARAYDLVLIAYLHLPWDAMRPILERAAAAVAPGGTLLLVGHDRRNLTEGYGGPPSAAVLYGPDDVVSALGDLRIERAETVEREVATGEGPRVALDVLVRARRER